MKKVRFILIFLLLMACRLGSKFTPSPTPFPPETQPPTSTVPDPTTPVIGILPIFPENSAPCPEFKNGWVAFSPDSLPSRQVYLWVGDKGGGPLVFFWHGAGGSAENARVGLGPLVIEEITAQGGVVASIEADPALSFGEWYLNTTDKLDDLQVADMVVACAVKVKNIDINRIHVAGFSAGGKQAAQMAIRRSNYVASVVLYSGGLFPLQLNPYPPYQNLGNKFASMVFWGGPSDVVLTDNVIAARDYATFVSANGNPVIMCDHNLGHTIPPEGQASAWRFFQDHPWGVSPEPWSSALPVDIPAYCSWFK